MLISICHSILTRSFRKEEMPNKEALNEQNRDLPLLLGAHTSAAGGLHNALYEGKQIGATTIQLFTSNQRQWKHKELTDEQLQLWQKALEETEIKQVMSHDSYLINLGSSDAELLQKSRDAFSAELIRCHQLNISYLNFHPGAAVKSSKEACLNTIVESLIAIAPLAQKGPTRLLLECTAGQGSTVGSAFEELAYIVERVEHHLPIGICLDTCHAFVAGYDLRSKEACEQTFADFEKIIGLRHLYALHLNDSTKGLGSRVDRHRPLGEGMIGWECFAFLMQDPRTKYLPKYLETPEGPPLWKQEISKLRQLAESQ